MNPCSPPPPTPPPPSSPRLRHLSFLHFTSSVFVRCPLSFFLFAVFFSHFPLVKDDLEYDLGSFLRSFFLTLFYPPFFLSGCLRLPQDRRLSCPHNKNIPSSLSLLFERSKRGCFGVLVRQKVDDKRSSRDRIHSRDVFFVVVGRHTRQNDDTHLFSLWNTFREKSTATSSKTQKGGAFLSTALAKKKGNFCPRRVEN